MNSTCGCPVTTGGVLHSADCYTQRPAQSLATCPTCDRLRAENQEWQDRCLEFQTERDRLRAEHENPTQRACDCPVATGTTVHSMDCWTQNHKPTGCLSAEELEARPACRRCSGPVVEFSVPSETWNAVIRPDGRERDDEYICFDCWHRAVLERNARLRAELAEAKAEVEYLGDQAVQTFEEVAAMVASEVISMGRGAEVVGMTIEDFRDCVNKGDEAGLPKPTLVRDLKMQLAEREREVEELKEWKKAIEVSLDDDSLPAHYRCCECGEPLDTPYCPPCVKRAHDRLAETQAKLAKVEAERQGLASKLAFQTERANENAKWAHDFQAERDEKQQALYGAYEVIRDREDKLTARDALIRDLVGALEWLRADLESSPGTRRDRVIHSALARAREMMGEEK